MNILMLTRFYKMLQCKGDNTNETKGNDFSTNGKQDRAGN